MRRFMISTSRRVRVLTMLLLILGMGEAYSLDLEEVWKGGDLWKVKRQPMWDDEPFATLRKINARGDGWTVRSRELPTIIV